MRIVKRIKRIQNCIYATWFLLFGCIATGQTHSVHYSSIKPLSKENDAEFIVDEYADCFFVMTDINITKEVRFYTPRKRSNSLP